MVRPPFLRIRGYHSLWHGIPADFCSERGYYPLHLLRRYRRRIQRDLSGFQSLLLTGSHCFLFLPLLRCFISGNCCTLTCAAKPRDRRLRASPPGLSQLAAWPCGPQPSHPLCGVANLHIATKLTSVKIPGFLQINLLKSCRHFTRITARRTRRPAGNGAIWRRRRFPESRGETEYSLWVHASLMLRGAYSTYKRAVTQ